MSAAEKVKEELRSVGLYTLFFGAWFSTLLLLKDLILAEYDIGISGVSAAFVGALILAKVVLLLEHVPLGAWTQRQPAWVDVVLRTLLYSVGVLGVLLLEKAFDVRHEKGGEFAALLRLIRQEDVHHVLANALCAGGALLVFNALSVIRRSLGAGVLRRILMTPLRESEPGKPA